MKSFKLLDKYIIRQLFETFLLGIIIFTSIMFASDTFLSLVKQMVSYGISFKIALLLVILNLPYVVVFTIPMAVLLATILTFNKLCLNSEIAVMRACGISISRLALPVIVFGILATVLSFVINEYIVPASNTQARILTLWALAQKNVPEGKTNFSIKELDNKAQLKRLFYIDSCKNKSLQGITVLDMSKKGASQIVQAKYGSSNPDYWGFNQAVIYTISRNSKILNTSTFNKFKLFTDLNIAKNTEHTAQELNYFELNKYIKRLKTQKSNIEAKLLIEQQEKLALPLTSLIVAIIGIPLALTPPRAKFNRGLLFSIFVIFCYYILRAFSISLGEAGKLDPLFSAWFPNIIMSITGISLFYKSN